MENGMGEYMQKQISKHMGEYMQKHAGKHLTAYMAGSIASRKNLLLTAGGALGAFAIIGAGKASRIARPALVGVVKEGYAFKEWVAGKAERVREDAQDIAAEAVHAYYRDLEATADTVKRERELLDKIEQTVEQRLAREKSDKEGK